MEDPNTTITHCRPTHGTLWKTQIQQSHTADQPMALCGRAEYYNYTLQTDPRHCMEESNTTITHCRLTQGTVWKSQIPKSHTADQPTALYGRAKYQNHTLQTNPRHCVEESNTTITHCRPTYGTVVKSQIPQSNTADQPMALFGRVKYHNHTLQTNPWHCLEESNTTITHCRPTHGTVWKSQILQSHTADQPMALCGRVKYYNHTLQTNPRNCVEESNTTITHCRPTHGTVWKTQIPQLHTADQPMALYGRPKYHNYTLQTNPWHCVGEPNTIITHCRPTLHCMEESNTTITHCRPTHGTVWKSQIPQSHTADQPMELYGRAKYHNHTLQTNLRHCMEEPNTTITHCRLTHGTVWKSQIPQSHTADQPKALCGNVKYHNHTLQTNPRHSVEDQITTITHCRPPQGTVWKSQILHSHTADKHTALYGRATYHKLTLQTNPWNCVEGFNTTITHCRPTHGTVWKTQIPQSHTADQPTALYGRAKYHNHTLQINPRHCMEQPNTTISHCRPTQGTVWKNKILQLHTANQPMALCGRAKYHNHTLQTSPWHCVEESNTAITHCRPTHGTVWKSKIPQSHTADQPMELCGRVKYYNHTLQTNPRHCMEESNTTISHCRPTHGTVWKSQILQSQTADQPTALYRRAKYHNLTLQTNP